MDDAIQALPNAAFKKHAKIHRRKMLLWANMIENATDRSMYKQALIFLGFLQKDVDRHLIEVPVEEGEATKEDIDRMIATLEAELRSLEEENGIIDRGIHDRKNWND